MEDIILEALSAEKAEASYIERVRANVLQYCRDLRAQGGQPSAVLAKIEVLYLAKLGGGDGK